MCAQAGAGVAEIRYTMITEQIKEGV